MMTNTTKIEITDVYEEEGIVFISWSDLEGSYTRSMCVKQLHKYEINDMTIYEWEKNIEKFKKVIRQIIANDAHKLILRAFGNHN